MGHHHPRGSSSTLISNMSSISGRHSIPMRFQFLCILFLLLAARPFASSSANHKNGKASLFSLFNLKEKSRFWSETVIRGGFDDLESSNTEKMSVVNYTKAGNIANFLKLLEVNSLYLPVPVNFIFVGFEGKGNHEFKLHPEELERWFMKLDHIFEHTRTPQVREVLTPFYKISVDKVLRHHQLPLVSHINYNFSIHAIQTAEKVASIFELARNVLSRKEDVSNNGDVNDALWQVDVDLMDVLFTSFVEYLQLENAYNIFILNLKPDAKRARYGYRSSKTTL